MVASTCSYTSQFHQCFPKTQQSLRYCSFTSIVILLGLRSLNTKPKFRAADTSAASSGDCAWYSSLPVGKRNFNLLHFFNNIQPVINTGRISDNSNKAYPFWYTTGSPCSKLPWRYAPAQSPSILPKYPDLVKQVMSADA
jgi:hypothetical protein